MTRPSSSRQSAGRTLASVLAAVLANVIVALAALPNPVKADLPFTVSYPRQCTPLNVTFTPDKNAFPYNVYILSVGAMVQSYRIDADYQTGKEYTFQWKVPKPSSTFSTFVVAIADALGNGNSTGVMSVDTSGGSSNCQPYAATTAFNFAADSTTASSSDRTECGNIRYYPVLPPYRGTAPFSISIVPLHSQPFTVDVPSSALRNQSYFVYTSKLPLNAGTQFYQFMSDASGGGSGGGSPIYTVAPSSDSSCLNERLDNINTSVALPLGQTTAVYQNLPGALTSSQAANSSTNSSTSGNKNGNSSSNVGGIVGGVIGAVIGVCGILLLVALFLLYRRRQKRKQELERKEQPQFIDLDDDEEDRSNALPTFGASFGRSSGRRGSRVNSFSVSPFTYDPAQQQANNTQPLHEIMAGEPTRSRNNSLGPTTALGADTAPQPFHSASSSYTAPMRDGGYASASLGVPRSSTTNAPGTESEHTSVYSHGGAGAGVGLAALAGSHRSPSSVSGSGNAAVFAQRPSERYVLRAHNDDEAIQRSRPSFGDVAAQAPAEASPLPRKTEAYPGQEQDEDGSRAAAHVMQHTDGGPLRNSSNQVEELPPLYGQWNSKASSGTA